MSEYYKTRATSPWECWFPMFTAVLTAILVGGLILGLAVRFYVRESVKDTLNTKAITGPQ